MKPEINHALVAFLFSTAACALKESREAIEVFHPTHENAARAVEAWEVQAQEFRLNFNAMASMPGLEIGLEEFAEIRAWEEAIHRSLLGYIPYPHEKPIARSLNRAHELAHAARLYIAGFLKEVQAWAKAEAKANSLEV